MSVVGSLEEYLARLPEDVAGSPRAAAARVLAKRLDDSKAKAYAVAAASKELREVLTEIEQVAPIEPQDDEIERARKRRAARLEGKPAAGATPSP